MKEKEKIEETEEKYENMYLCQEVVMNILDSQIGLEIQRINIFLHLEQISKS